jgi:hypothetical protein
VTPALNRGKKQGTARTATSTTSRVPSWGRLSQLDPCDIDALLWLSSPAAWATPLSDELHLSQLRKARGLMQETMANLLSVSQAEVSNRSRQATPHISRFPIGSCPGHSAFATRSLMTTTAYGPREQIDVGRLAS